jgi:hypothetical protein
MPPLGRRLRGSVLRLVRRRTLAIALGLCLVLPAAWVQLSPSSLFPTRYDTWWLNGLSLVVGATGLALFWTGLTGVAPDWLDE